MRRPPRPLMPALMLGGAVVVVAGCTAEPATQQGQAVADLYSVFMIAAAVVFAIVAALLAWAVIRYRGSPGRDVPLPRQVHGHLGLEVAWWALPTALVAVLAILTVNVLGRVDARAETPDLMVEVRGFQWGWEFRYANTDVVVSGTAADPPTLVLPTERSVAFVIGSHDVVHSFNIPAFLIKRDAVPGRENRFDVVIDEVGTYGGQCGEFCGLLHANQRFEIDARTEADFDAWLQAEAAALDAGAARRTLRAAP